MITSILMFVGGLSAGVILGGFGGFAAANSVAKLMQAKTRAELPDDELYREAYNEVATITGDIKVTRKKPEEPKKPEIKFLTGDVGLFFGQRWKIPGVKHLVSIHTVKDGVVTYTWDNMTATINIEAFKKYAKAVDE